MNHGIQAEHQLEEICISIFGPDIVARSPQLIEKNGHRELADILVECHDTLLIFQSKSVEVTVQELDDIKQGRIDKKLDAAQQQLATTLNAAPRGAKSRYRNARGIEMPVAWERITKSIGIVILNIVDLEHSVPSSRYQLDSFVNSFRGIDVHYFLLSDLRQASILLTTFKDFTDYLDMRSLAAAKENCLIGNELDLLSFFKTRYDDLENILEGPAETRLLLLEPGSWEHTVNIKKLMDKSVSNKEESAPIDKIISMIYTTIDYEVSRGNLDETQAVHQYRVVAGLLNRMCRVARRQVSRKLQEKRINTLQKQVSYFIQIDQTLDCAFLFLATNTPKGPPRSDQLFKFAIVAAQNLLKKCPVTHLIGIATEGKKLQGLSVDYLYGTLPDLAEAGEFDNLPQIFQEPLLRKVDEWEQT